MPESAAVTLTPEGNPFDQITSIDFFHGTGGFLSLVPGKGIVMRGKLTFDEWRKALYALHSLRDITHIAMADVINIGKREYGETLVQEALQQLEFPFAEEKRAAAIENVPWTAREFELEEEHFFAAGSANLQPEETAKWLGIATEEKLTPLELKRSIEIGKVIHNEQTPVGKAKKSGIVTMAAVVALYLQWKRNNYFPLLNDATKKQQSAVLAELEPIAELIDKLRAAVI